MQTARRRFSPFVYFYLVTFFLLLGFLPICLVATIGDLAAHPHYWVASLIWPVGMIALAFYAQRRCSSERMRFRDGLLWITASMMTGWVYMSFLTVWPALFIAFLGSVVFAIYGDLNRQVNTATVNTATAYTYSPRSHVSRTRRFPAFWHRSRAKPR